MTSLSDFPPDVQAAAAKDAAEFIEWLIPAPHDYAGSEDVLAKVIARAIVTDRAGRLNTTGLTTQQSACLRAIAEHQSQHGISPTHDELASALGLASKSGVARLLLALETRGRILRPANRARAITIIANPN